MNFVNRQESVVIIRQVPFLLLLATAFFSLPFFAFSLYHIAAGTDVDGKYFCLFLGFFLLWVLLEFLATRERMVIDLNHKVLTRFVRGMFRNTKQVINLNEMNAIRLEEKVNERRGGHRYLYIYGNGKEFLINRPSITYINHGKMGMLISEATGIPYKGEVKNLAE